MTINSRRPWAVALSRLSATSRETRHACDYYNVNPAPQHMYRTLVCTHISAYLD